ncbi:hypothetical protein OYC64_012281 [Pagothenia borchgrevinki]|uniref:Isoaspartyl peptidase/L-asparaginase n=1 Tax=Pagothenia borchgrevinki TaxID=8213 RepID=A0ABD2G8Z0_PAGBO
MSAVVVVHGGPWAIPEDLAKASVDGVKAAARQGSSVLKGGGSALDVVEAAVMALEDNPAFNADIPYHTDRQRCKPVCREYRHGHHDTVGAVAVDSDGNVACATSTGGLRYKMVGRVGDSPIIGSGGYADNLSGAVSCTGHGESILKVTLARLILSHVEQGKSLADSSQLSLQYMGDRVRGAGGAIVVSPSGQWAATFSTERMVWASVDQDVLWYGLHPKEKLNEKLCQ